MLLQETRPCLSLQSFFSRNCVFPVTGDDLRISVNMRGGPEKWQVTGWLQIVDLQKQHEGDYTCVAQNEHGVDKATARVNVVDPGEG